MPQKRSRSLTPESEPQAGPSQDPKRARRSEDSEVEDPEPPLTQTEGDVSDLEDNEEEVEQQIPNAEDEARFEAENEERFREKVEKASEPKGIGVSHSAVRRTSPAEPYAMPLECSGDGYH